MERAGPANGGALSTASGLVFQGTGSGEFTALDAQTGEPLWSSPTQTGVIAAPMMYEVDGKQYVAILVGTGGSWAMFGSADNMKGYKVPNISRLLVYSLGGTAKLPDAPALLERRLSPPPQTASAESQLAGIGPYHTYCGNCHGVGAINLGILSGPALQRSSAHGRGLRGRRAGRGAREGRYGVLCSGPGPRHGRVDPGVCRCSSARCPGHAGPIASRDRARRRWLRGQGKASAEAHSVGSGTSSSTTSTS